MPYAAWCRSCAAGEGKADGHILRTSDDMIQLKNNATHERCLLVLDHKFYGDRWVTATVVPLKSPEEYAVKATAEDLQQSDMCRFLYKSDGEQGIKSLKQHADQKLSETVGPVDVIFRLALRNCSKMRAIWAVQSENIGPGVSRASPGETSSDTRRKDLCN